MKTKDFIYTVGTVLAYDNMIIKIKELREQAAGGDNAYFCQAIVPGCKEVQEVQLCTEDVNDAADLRLPEDWEKALHGQHVLRIGTILAYDGKVMKVQGWGPSVYHCLVVDPDKQNVADVWYKTMDLNARAIPKQPQDWGKAIHYQELMRAAISAYRKALEDIAGGAGE